MLCAFLISASPKIGFACAYEQYRVNHVALSVVLAQVNGLRQFILCLGEIPFLEEGEFAKPSVSFAQRLIEFKSFQCSRLGFPDQGRVRGAAPIGKREISLS